MISEGRATITLPNRSGTGTIDRATLNATLEIPFEGLHGLVFRLQGMGGGAVVKFEVKNPGSTLWSFLAAFNMADGAGTAFTNDFETQTTIDGTWIATGTSGWERMRLRVSTAGTAGTLTVDWQANANHEYGFAQIFGDLKHDSPALAMWPVVTGGEAFSAAGGQTLTTLPAPVSASGDRVRQAMSLWGEARVMQSDRHLSGTIDATGESVTLTTEGAHGIAVHVTGTWNPGAGGQLVFQMSHDGSDYNQAVGYNIETFSGAFDLASGAAGAANANGTWLMLLAQGAAYVRVLHSGGTWSSGSATVVIRGYAAPPIQANFSFGDKAHDAADGSTAPMKMGHRAIAHGANPAAVAADDRSNWYASRHGIPFVIGGHMNLVTREYRATTAQTDDDMVGPVGAGAKLVLTSLGVFVDHATTVDVGVRIGFGTASVPAEPADGAGVNGVVLSHPGIAAGSGVVIGDGSGIIGIGADGEELRITNEVPTTGSIKVIIKYYAIES